MPWLGAGLTCINDVYNDKDVMLGGSCADNLSKGLIERWGQRGTYFNSH